MTASVSEQVKATYERRIRIIEVVLPRLLLIAEVCTFMLPMCLRPGEVEGFTLSGLLLLLYMVIHRYIGIIKNLFTDSVFYEVNGLKVVEIEQLEIEWEIKLAHETRDLSRRINQLEAKVEALHQEKEKLNNLVKLTNAGKYAFFHTNPCGFPRNP